jgi:hypothetical protein
MYIEIQKRHYVKQSAFLIDLHIVEDNISILIDYYFVAAESTATAVVVSTATAVVVSTVAAAESVVASVEAAPHAVKAAIAKIANTFFIRMSLMFK